MHLAVEGEPLSILLDVIEVAQSHTGVALAKEFVCILREFAIEHKVSMFILRKLSLLTIFQLLRITCDNTSVDETMIDEMEKKLDDFPGSANRTRCFDHIINLVAKTITKAFDVPERKAGEDLNNGDKELLDLAGEADWEESYMKDLECVEGAEEEEDDDIDGWTNEEVFLSEEERKEMSKDMLLVWTVLIKVPSLSLADGLGADRNRQLRKLAFKIVNSSLHHVAACLEGDVEVSRAGRGVSAQGHSNEVELNLPHVGLRSPPWGGVGSFERRRRVQLEGSRAERGRMEVGGAVARCSQGKCHHSQNSC